jgi:hypothetical protein
MATETVERGLPKRARLWNDGASDFVQTINGEDYHIPKGKYIELARRVAVAVRGSYLGKNVAVNLRLEMIADGDYDTDLPSEDPTKTTVFGCPYCDNEYTLKDDLREHMKSHRGGPKKAEEVKA